MATFNDGLERRARSWADRLDSGHRDPTTDEKAAFFLFELRREFLPLLKKIEKHIAAQTITNTARTYQELREEMSKWKS